FLIPHGPSECLALARGRRNLNHHCLLNRFLDRQSPTFRPSGASSGGQCLSRSVQPRLQFCLLRGGKRSAYILAQRGRSSRQPQRTRRLMLNSRYTREGLQQSRNSAFVVQVLEHLYAFAIQRTRRGVVALFSRQASQVSQCGSDAPAIAEFAENCEALFIECASCG